MSEPNKQATTPQQKSLNPNNEKAAPVKLDPLAFAPQIFLLDMFSEDNGIAGLKLKKEPNSAQHAPNVPKLTDGQVEKVNNILDINFKKIAGFMNSVSTNEIAQLVPEINMFIMDSKDPSKQLRIPLSDSATLKNSNLGSLGYYAGNAIGLQNLEMILDGSRNPAYNKAYLVKMTFVLDSINTFTDTIPGSSAFGNLTYADIFRSGGSPGALNDRYFIKLTISHSSSPKNNILEKYNLESDDMTFSLSLTLRESSFGVGENLKTTANVTFTGYEENLYERKDLFDFLSLNFEDVKREIRNTLNKAKNTFRIAKATAEEKAKKFVEIEKEKYDEDFANQQAIVAKHFGGNEAAARDFLRRFKTISDKYRETQGQGSSNVKEIYENILDQYDVEGEGDYDEFETIIEPSEAVVYNLPERMKKFEEAVEIDKNVAIGKAQADFEAVQNVENAKLDNLRMNEISRVLETAFFGKEYYDAGIIKTVQVTSEQLQAYFEKQNTGLDPEVSIKNLKSKDSKDAAQPTESKPSPVKNTSTPNEPDHKQIEDLNNRIKNKDAEIAKRRRELNATNEDEKSHESDEKYKKLVEQRDELRKQLKEVTQYSQVLGGSIADIMSKLNNYKQFDYILLGDLLRLTFNKLFNNIFMDHMNKDKGGGGFLESALNTIKGFQSAQTGVQNAILTRTRLLLSDIVLPKNGQSSINVTRNLFDLPISIKNLKFIFADKIFGKSKNNYTLFELLDDVAKLVSISFQNKAILLNDTSPKRKYSIQKATYSLKGEDPNFTIISTKNKTPDLKHGVVVYFRSTEENYKRDTSYESNLENKIPHLYFGGYDRGAVKKLELELHQKDNMQLAVMEQLGGTAGKVIPAFFKSKVTLLACPIFYLAMEYYISTPTINPQKESPWLYAEGFYGVKHITHSYTAGGPFQTVVEGLRLNATQETKNKTKPVKLITAQEARDLALKDVEDNGVEDEYKTLRDTAFKKDADRIRQEQEDVEEGRKKQEATEVWTEGQGTNILGMSWVPFGQGKYSMEYDINK